MEIELSPQQVRAQEEFRTFAQNEITPFADQWDREEAVPAKIIEKMADAGY